MSGFSRVSLCSILLLGACSEEGFRGRQLDVAQPPRTFSEEPTPLTTLAGDPCVEGGVSWNLIEAWRMGHHSRAVSVGRLFDSDGDGDVDLDDPPTLVSSELGLGGDRVEFFSYGDVTTTNVVSGAERSPARLGDLDGRPGAEIAIAWHAPDERRHRASVYGAHVSIEHRLPAGSTSTPWLADVDHDGRTDILVNGGAVDALVGDVARSFPSVGTGGRSVAVDLDLDRQVELITALPDGRGVRIGILGDNDQIARPCVVVENDYRTVRYAVGNFDNDDFGEFVVASDDIVAICDTDGTEILSERIDLDEPYMVGIGDLDDDDLVEIIITGEHGEAGATRPRLMVLDRFLRLRWERFDGPWFFSLADLDGDGAHEVLVQGEAGFRVLDGEGDVLASWGVRNGGGVIAQPVVADVDQDGLAEIILPHTEGIVLETPLGGFPTPGAADGWSGVDHFPGLLAADGSLDTVGAHWLLPGGNTWQGHPRCVHEDEEDEAE